MLWARDKRVTSTQNVAGKQLLQVAVPVRAWRRLAPCHGATPAMGPHLPRITVAAQESWKNTGMLAGVTDCRRSQKWGCRGRLALGFKPRLSSHTRVRTTRLWQRRERGPSCFGRVGTPWWLHSWWSQDPESRTSTLFPEIRPPRLGRGRRKDCVRLWVF